MYELGMTVRTLLFRKKGHFGHLGAKLQELAAPREVRADKKGPIPNRPCNTIPYAAILAKRGKEFDIATYKLRLKVFPKKVSF